MKLLIERYWQIVLIALALAACQGNALERSVQTPAETRSSALTSPEGDLIKKATLTAIPTNFPIPTDIPSPTITVKPTTTLTPTQTHTSTISPTPTITPTPVPEDMIVWNMMIPESVMGSWCESWNVTSKLYFWQRGLADAVLNKTNYASMDYFVNQSFQNLPPGVKVSKFSDKHDSCITVDQPLSPGEIYSRFDIKLDIIHPDGLENPEDTAYIHFKVLPSVIADYSLPLIAYSSSVYRYYDGPIIGDLPPQLNGSNIFIESVDGSMLTNLTNESPNELASGWDYPAWSPNGKQLAMVQLMAGIPKGIYTIYIDRSGLTQLTEDGLFPAWSPDGMQIAFINAGIWSINADGSELTQLSQNPADTFAWSPNGTRIAYTSERNIWVLYSDGSGQNQLTQEEGISPAWSPDNSKIVYVSKNNIWAMNSDGSGQHQVVKGRTPSSSPAWSPDGSRIAFISGGQIYTVAENGSGLSPVTPKGISATQVSWSADGKKILFTTPSDIYVINPDGSGMINVSLNDFAVENWVSWQPIP